MQDKEYIRWYKCCEFIEEEMQFYSFIDFVNNAKRLKYTYERIPKEIKKLYKWYVYASPLNYNQKCLIWNYLNDFNEYEDLLFYKKKN